MSDTRRDLAYATAQSDRHTVTVATWTAGTELGYRIMLDSRELDAGTITR